MTGQPGIDVHLDVKGDPYSWAERGRDRGGSQEPPSFGLRESGWFVGGRQACELNGKLMGFGLSAVYAAYIRHRPQLDSCCVLPRVYSLYLEAFHRCSTPLTALLRLHRGDATHGVFLAAYRTRPGPTGLACTPARAYTHLQLA